MGFSAWTGAWAPSFNLFLLASRSALDPAVVLHGAAAGSNCSAGRGSLGLACCLGLLVVSAAGWKLAASALKLAASSFAWSSPVTSIASWVLSILFDLDDNEEWVVWLSPETKCDFTAVATKSWLLLEECQHHILEAIALGQKLVQLERLHHFDKSILLFSNAVPRP